MTCVALPFVKRMCRHGLDLYLSGHDHSLQWLYAQCDRNHPERQVEFIVSGAGGKDLTGIRYGTNPDRIPESERRERHGFVYLVIDGPRLTATIVSASNPEAPREVFSRSWSK
jgi:hypothetical protein